MITGANSVFFLSYYNKTKFFSHKQLTHQFFLHSLSGGELFDRIAAEDYKMSEAEVINYMRQVCDGLRYMHENSIVHLDVKVSFHEKFLPVHSA